jgi:hypothetical protein
MGEEIRMAKRAFVEQVIADLRPEWDDLGVAARMGDPVTIPQLIGLAWSHPDHCAGWEMRFARVQNKRVEMRCPICGAGAYVVVPDGQLVGDLIAALVHGLSDGSGVH